MPKILLTSGNLLLTCGNCISRLNMYLCFMKTLFVKSYRRFYFLIWIGIVLLFCIQWIYDATFIEVVFFSVTTFVPPALATDVLSNRLLPRAIKRGTMKRFVLYFLLTASFMAFWLSVNYHAYHWLENNGYFPGSVLIYVVHSFPVEFLAAIPSAVVINFGFCGLRFFYEHNQLKKVHAEAQLQMLQQQINPHFMFNVLNHIHILMEKDVDLADELLIKYSEILRYQLYDGKKEYVSIAHEVQFISNYVDIEKTRWGNELEVSCNWKVEDGKQQIPPLLLIGFVENAFKHVSRSTGERSFVHIDFQQSGNTVRLDIENSKCDTPPSPVAGKSRRSSGLGLENIRRRLDILYANRYRLDIADEGSTYASQLVLTV